MRFRAVAVTGTFLVAIAVTLAFVFWPGRDGSVRPEPRPTERIPVSSAPPNAGIAELEAHVREDPGDSQAWAALGIAYVDHALANVDHSYFPKADKALTRSLTLEPDYNELGFAGRGELALARNNFPSAVGWAERALALNDLDARASGVRVDALTAVGRLDEALATAEKAHAAAPSVETITRLATQSELRGDVERARDLLRSGISLAKSPPERAFITTRMGDLARGQGDYKEAAAQFAAALKADPTYVPALAGSARTLHAQGHAWEAVRQYLRVTLKFPEPRYLIELGDLYTSLGQPTRAAAQYRVVDMWADLAAQNGVRTTMEMSLYAADHGNPRLALRLAEAEWKKRHNIQVADALAWSLHAAGRDKEALTFAERAAGTGYRNASFLYHRGMIELALGDTETARQTLVSALKLDPAFSPTQAKIARDKVVELNADVRS